MSDNSKPAYYYEPEDDWAPLASKGKAKAWASQDGNSTATFSVTCSCKRVIGVESSQAGSTVICECGAEVQVPSLGRLRVSVGSGAYESSTQGTILRLIQTGKLPSGRTCAVSCKPTEYITELDVYLPRSFGSGPRFIVGHPLFVLLYMYLSADRPEFDLESADRLRVPIHVSEKCVLKLRTMSEGRLKRVLRTVPVYAKLLDENRYAKVQIPSL